MNQALHSCAVNAMASMGSLGKAVHLLFPPKRPPPPTPTRTLVQRSPARPRSKIYVKTPHQRGARAAPRIFWLAGPTRPFLFLKKRKGKRVEGVQVFRSSQKYCVSAFRSVIIPRSPPDRA